MSSFSDTSAAVPLRLEATRANQQYFTVFGVFLVIVNLLTFLFHFSAALIFNAISNATCIALLAYSVWVIIRAPSDRRAGTAFLVAALAMTTLSALFNYPETFMTDALKYLSVYIFYCAGYACGGRIRPIELRGIYVLAALPIIFRVLFGNTTLYPPPEEPFSYLANANTGVLYFAALLFAVAHRYGNRVILLQLVNVAVMNKIGALVATTIAICLWILVPLRKESIIALLVIGVAGVLGVLIGAFDRAISAFENLVLIFNMSPAAVSSMSYGQLVRLTGSTDLSAFFRIMHWSDIWDTYSSGGVLTWLFGYGAGQTARLTYAGMVPHNDYLRILVEYGLLNLAIFASFLLYIRKALTDGATKVLFVVLCIYFFSENLLDSFTSMALFFAYAGRFAAATERD